MKEKLTVLCATGVIQEDVKLYCFDVIALLNMFGIHKEDEYDMLITHLAMASQRVRNKESVGKLSEEIWMQVLESPYYEKSEQLCRNVSNLAPYSFPEEEEQYLIMHFCSLLKNLEESK